MVNAQVEDGCQYDNQCLWRGLDDLVGHSVRAGGLSEFEFLDGMLNVFCGEGGVGSWPDWCVPNV